MNNIGFAAKNSTAATNNNTATQNTSNLSTLANSFSGSSSASSSSFNTLILGLFIQIIQALLKNMQNKPCCDQPPKPTEKPLDLSDTQLNKLDKLPSLEGEPGSDPTIKSVIDTDGNNQLSVGDKVNLEQVTDQSDANGQAIIKTSTKALTANDLSIYNSLKAPNQLSDADTERVQSAINLLAAVGAKGAPQATGCYYDNDADGKLSVGDQVEALLFTDGSGAPTPDGAYTVTKKTVDEAFLANYNKPLILSDVQKEKLEDALFFGINFVGGNVPHITSIEDSDKSGSLSVGDKVNFEQSTGQEDDQGNVIIRYTSSEITQEVLDRYQNTNTVNLLSLSAEQIANINSGYSFEDVNFNPATDQAIDVNEDGKLSAGDTLSGLISNTNGDTVGNWTHNLTNDDANVINGGYGNILVSKTESNLENALLRERLGEVLGLPIFEGNSVKTIFDKDNNGELSAGDIALVTQGRYFVQGVADGQISTEPTPYFPDNYIALTADEVKQVNAGTISIPDSQKASLEKLLNMTNSSLVDSDSNGVLSKGDVLTGLSAYGTSDRKVLTDEMAGQALGKYGAELALSSQETQAMSDTLDLKAKSIFGDWFAKSIVVQAFDTDSSGNISTGDTLSLRPEFYTTPYAEQINYHQLNNEEIDKLKSAGLI